MDRRLKNFDFILFFGILLIIVFNIPIFLSISPEYIPQQSIHLLVGLGLFFLFSIIDYKIFKNFKIHLYLFSLCFLALTFLLGNITRGAIRWIRIFNFSFQPSELTKPFFVLFFAAHAANVDLKNPKNFVINFLLFILPAFLIFIQPSFGNSIIIFLVWLVITLASGANKIYPFSILILVFLLSPIFWRFLKEYQKQRILSFLSPQKDPLGAGYHLIQSIIAIGAGQFVGRGLGQGTQSHLQFLPERHTDFIFASFAEEFGFLGSLGLITVYFLILLRILIIAQKAEDKFAVLVCLGVFSLLFSHLFINIGMNLGLLPITGITLPLFSAGGSSLISTLICLGLVESISCHQKPKETFQIS